MLRVLVIPPVLTHSPVVPSLSGVAVNCGYRKRAKTNSYDRTAFYDVLSILNNKIYSELIIFQSPFGCHVQRRQTQRHKGRADQRKESTFE